MLRNHTDSELDQRIAMDIPAGLLAAVVANLPAGKSADYYEGVLGAITLATNSAAMLSENDAAVFRAAVGKQAAIYLRAARSDDFSIIEEAGEFSSTI